MITEEKLVAYVDGELSAEERKWVEAALAEDPILREAVAREKQLRTGLSNLYNPALEEKVPERLAALLRGPENRVVPIGKPRPALRFPRWGQFAAIAASLVLGIFLGQSLNAPPGMDESKFVAEAQLAEALDTQLASAQPLDAPIQVGISFVGPGGQACRTFESPNGAGLACRSEEDWQLRLFAPGQSSSRFQYEQAGSAAALVMRSAQELLVGEPMDAIEEQQARDAGWPRIEQ